MNIGFKAIIALVLFLPAGIVNSDEGKAQDSIEARYAYTMGYRIGQMLQAQGVKQLDNKNFIQGMDDFFKGNESRLDEIEMNDAVVSFQQHIKRQRKSDPQANLSEGQKFLAQNKLTPEVVESASGLQYQVISQGSGLRPTRKSTVLVHYLGSLINGDVFDSSLQRGQPAEFKLDQVIPGFSEALTNMRVGDKWRIFVPPSLGYGINGVAGVIGPNETLVFEIELLSIVATE